MIYAGIGSRETPDHEWQLMCAFANVMAKRGHILRSGGATGADNAFKMGHTAYTLDNYIEFRPEHATPQAMSMASTIHPNWSAVVKQGLSTRQKHGRNCMILLGQDLKEPADFVVCWTKGGALVGGTAMGMRVAWNNKIPILNIYHMEALKKIYQMIADPMVRPNLY